MIRPISFLGDVMLGRLVDAVSLPYPIKFETEGGRSISDLGASIRSSYNNEKSPLGMYNRLWGDTADIIKGSGMTLLNLECALTCSEDKWTNKRFTYRMNPLNKDVLSCVPITYACIANNHVLDYGVEGMMETIQTLRSLNISATGAGENLDTASKPCFIETTAITPRIKRVMITSFSDHGCCEIINGKEKWAADKNKPGIYWVDVRSMTNTDMVCCFYFYFKITLNGCLLYSYLFILMFFV